MTESFHETSPTNVLRTEHVLLERRGRVFARLPDISLAAARCVALIGASGPGKTTALLAIMTARTRDLALLRTLGARPLEIARIALAEAALLALGAAVLGFGVAVGLTSLGASLIAARDGLIVSAAPQWAEVGWIVLGTMIAALIAAVVPAWRAARAPIDTILVP